MRPVLALLISYLLGSIPFGYLIVRAKEDADVRASGSGGTGATNVSRRAGKSAGILTLLLDAAKGALAVIIARWLLGGDASLQWWLAGAAFVAVLAHCFPVWLGFHGGKGVATGVGVFLALSPLALVGSALVFILIVAVTRYISLGSIMAAGAFPFFLWLSHNYFVRPSNFNAAFVAAVACCVLIIFMHRANIQRLLQGTESKFR